MVIPDSVQLMTMRELHHEVVRLRDRRNELNVTLACLKAKIKGIRDAFDSTENDETVLNIIREILAVE